MRFLYTLGILVLGAATRIVSLFNKKAKLWVEGREGIFDRMVGAISPDARIVWFHAASLGEFEQGRPVIEAFRAKCPDYKILLTFYSPSGYEVRKNYAGADYIFYLLEDTPRNARRFIHAVRPEIAVFIKYEFWVNYLLELKRSGTRTYIISSIFRSDQRFFKWYGHLFRRALTAFEHIFVQNAESEELLGGIGFKNVSIAGDTRFDRVYKVACEAGELPAVSRFAGGGEVLVAGSTWPQDEELLVRLINKTRGLKLIIAPHEIDGQRIARLCAEIGKPCIRYTEITDGTGLEEAQVLFVDTIGILSSVYRYGKYAYIGGGFGAGIHNTLEAAAFGLPLVFGPNYGKFREARDLIACGGAESISGYDGLQNWLDGFRNDHNRYASARDACSDYVRENLGATERIIGAICR